MTSPETDSTEADAQSENQTPELNRLDVLRGLRISIWEASYATVWSALTTGAFLTGYALWLGANDLALGLITAIPIFAGLIQIVASYVGENKPERRTFVARYAVLGRSQFLLILLLPILFRRQFALVPFLILFTLSYVFLNITVPAWTSWMSDLVPPDHRGRYFGKRNMIAGVVGMVIGLPAAWFLDVATHKHHWENIGFGTLFGVAVIGGLLSFGCLLRQPEPRRRREDKDGVQSGIKGAIAYFRTPFADANFRRLIIFNAVFGLGQNFAAPFFMVYAIKILLLNYRWLQILATLNGVAALCSMPLWGYLTDKFGNKPLLGLCGLSSVTFPIFFIFASHDRPVLALALVIANNVLAGLLWAGFGLAQFSLMIGLSPPQRTPVYVATMSAITGLAGGLAPLIGGITMQALAGFSHPFLGVTMQNFHITFAIASLLRLGALVLLRPVVDSGAASATEVLQQLGRAHPRAWLQIRRLQHGADEESRLLATQSLAISRTRLAAGELMNALSDPSLTLREEAARALGEIGDPQSVDALIAMLDPASGIVEEAARALGRIGDRQANGGLIRLLESGDEALTRADRIAAIRALGRTGGRDAGLALMNLLAAVDPASDPEIPELLVRALGIIGDRHSAPMLAARLMDPDTPRPLRLALIRALGEIGDQVALPALRSALVSARTDAASLPLIADALERLQDRESVVPLVAELLRLSSPIGRKQVANAIGGLLGDGEPLYVALAAESYGRDAVLQKTVQELERRCRSSAAAPLLSAALNSYLTGDYAASLRAVGEAANALQVSSVGEAELSRSVVSFLATTAAEDTPIEAVLVAIFALRNVIALT